MAGAVVVARTKLNGLEYLADRGWPEATDTAARCQTGREATRAAMRLPSRFRAFALPMHLPAEA